MNMDYQIGLNFSNFEEQQILSFPSVVSHMLSMLESREEMKAPFLLTFLPNKNSSNWS